MDYSQRLHNVIPGGCHTYSRGDDQFPSNAPQILVRGDDCYVFDDKGRRFLDYGMGLRAVACGYNEPSIVAAAIQGMVSGNCLTRPSMIELEAAEMFCDLMQYDMVKFCKNGSTATTAAVKLARAATGKKRVVCANQPFFSYDDWFISTTNRDKGCYPQNTTLEEIGDEVACYITEPCDEAAEKLEYCRKNGIIFILDEMITGFRYDWRSKLQPDLACYGKAMANGFSVACVAGKRELMNQDVFLASSTHGAEMCGLSAFMATVKFMQEHDVAAHLRYCRDYVKWPDNVERTLFQQELCKQGILAPWIAYSYAHKQEELDYTNRTIARAMNAIADGAKLEGPMIKPVFS